MKWIKLYFVPACFSALIFTGLFLAFNFFGKAEIVNPIPEKDLEYNCLPMGRALYAVVEPEGVYIGQQCILISDFDGYLESHGRMLNPDYLIVMGTARARYGDVAGVYASLHKRFNVPGTIETRPVEDGTRRGPIERHRHFWQY